MRAKEYAVIVPWTSSSSRAVVSHSSKERASLSAALSTCSRVGVVRDRCRLLSICEHDCDLKRGGCHATC